MGCDHDCSSCSEKCADRADMKEKQNEKSNVKRVIGVVSGKGGVGKSLVTSLLAVMSGIKGYKTAILDADVTGPSIPKIFGVKDKAFSEDGKYIMPVITKGGTKIMSVNLLLEEESDPVIWRGPVIAGTVKQFWTDVSWGDVDYMFVDMPPGTGDVPLTVFQSLPLDGIVIVASPQGLVSMIVEKAVNMAQLMGIPVLGLVENMSYVACPDCGKKIEIFGKSKADYLAEKFNIAAISKIPVKEEFSLLCDEGRIEEYRGNELETVFAAVTDAAADKFNKI